MANLLIFYFHLKMAIPATIAATPIHFLHEFGAGGALTVVVVQRLIGHQQLQELVAARAQRADLRDGVGIAVSYTHLRQRMGSMLNILAALCGSAEYSRRNILATAIIR